MRSEATEIGTDAGLEIRKEAGEAFFQEMQDGMGWDGNVVKHNDTWDEKSTGPNGFCWHEFPLSMRVYGEILGMAVRMGRKNGDGTKTYLEMLKLEEDKHHLEDSVSVWVLYSPRENIMGSHEWWLGTIDLQSTFLGVNQYLRP